MLSAPRQDFASPVRAVETTTPARKTTILGCEPLQERRGLPCVGPIAFGKAAHRSYDVRKTHGVGIEHRAAAEIRKAVACDVHDVDVGGARRNALLENAGALVDQRIEGTLDDLLIAHLAALQAEALGLLQHDLGDRLGRNGGALARLVVIPSRTAFLAEPAELANAVRYSREGPIGILRIQPFADRPADVVAGQVGDSIRPHGETEALERPVDLLRQRARIQQKIHLPEIGVQHPIADEAVAHARNHADFLDLFGDRERRGEHVLGGLGPAHDFQELGDVRRTEEMQSDDILWTVGDGSDLVEIERGGIRCEDGAHPRLAIERLEHLLLHPHVLEHRLDDKVGIRDVVVRQRAGDEREALLELRGREPAFLERTLIVLLDDRETLVERRLRGLEHRHSHTRIGEVHGDAAAHGSGADHGHGSDGTRRRARGNVGNLGRRPGGEKDVPQCLGHGSLEELREAGGLDLDTLVERLEHRRLDGVDNLDGRRVTLRQRRNRAARKIEESLGVRQHDRDVPRSLQG
jgi:hypothetical protein